MAVLIYKIVDFIRYVRAADINGVITQLAVWIAGVLVVFLVAQTNWASGVGVGDMNLANINAWSLLFYGLSVGSGASFIKDTLKSVDNTNSSQIPTLLRRTARHRAAPNEHETVG